jgi:hypothetical protein
VVGAVNYSGSDNINKGVDVVPPAFALVIVLGQRFLIVSWQVYFSIGWNNYFGLVAGGCQSRCQ